jgi:GDP-L-fucose synthase
MKILVTGASGFLGKILCEELKTQGHSLVEVSSKVADLTRQGSLAIFNQQTFDQIYHLAAWTQAGDFCLTHSGEQWIINQQINTHLLDWWHQKQPQAKLVAIGTSCSYDPNLPLKEENYLVGQPIEGLFVYAMTKRMLYSGMKAFAKQFDHKYLQVIPSTLYGAGYHTDGRQMHFIFDLIRKILRGKKLGEPVVLWGDGYQSRELVHVKDFMRIMANLNQKYENEIFNIGYGKEYTIREFAQSICDVVGYDFAKIQFDTTKYVGAKSKCLDVSKLKAAGELKDIIPLAEGLKETIQWFERTFFKE